ncbi:uncharacterized protein L3040_001458 [Drepanopeziza brunnea f. sp. 'multigermtubi']|uniref:Uncharacterized protein n=1 Tax=Marssonina brunnea f. sp. multigermtubi (strain MB_m1) TaxID=1072389 RepID=K1X7V8_MARBU|nr:uncharacterized protein MBM_05187 [Drepanopeziza brunnea f. sp. 'multigermtubi' MB_m1]EKD16718.1 hypothetical protein MBM_05187 [Drepanopeziza brunnea f. sp. 'multigermtubi' MB_m1]KAJ5051685.1 hypothetical protein L3040_001458 [Drepanopeziza brunnea f. sp. 'multigermtubi']
MYARDQQAELKDVLRRIQSRGTAGSKLASAIQGYSATSRASDLADLVKKACKVDKRCVPVVEEVLRANEQDRYSLREALFNSSDEDVTGPERLAFEVSSALRKRERKGDREDPAAASRKKRPAIPGAFKHKPVGKVSGPSRDIPAASAPRPKTKHSMQDVFDDFIARQGHAAFREEQIRYEQESLGSNLALQEQERLREVEATRKFSKLFGFTTCAQCNKSSSAAANKENSCVFHPGARRKYRNGYYDKSPKWLCCGRGEDDPGCRKSHHIDAAASGPAQRLDRLRKAGSLDASAVLFDSCSTYGEDTNSTHEPSQPNQKSVSTLPSSISNPATAATTAIGCPECKEPDARKKARNAPKAGATYPAPQKPNAIIDLTADSSDSDPDSDESEIEEILDFSSSSLGPGYYIPV